MFWQVTLSLLEGFGMTLTIFALTLLFAVLVGLALRPRIDRIDMAESMKSVE